MLRDEIARYTELSGNDGLHTSIGIIGAYLDGYEKGKADAEPRLNNHEVACIIADLMGDACACNHNGIDEWLPKFCDFANTDACPHPVGVACWEQYLKWKGKNDET